MIEHAAPLDEGTNNVEIVGSAIVFQIFLPRLANGVHNLLPGDRDTLQLFVLTKEGHQSGGPNNVPLNFPSAHAYALVLSPR